MIALLEAHRAGLLAGKYLPRNLLAGLIVGVVALPLAMAFAIASGAKPEQGIYTAIVGGLCAALFGGSRVQISGPTGAFIVILAGITAHHGIAGLQIATLMAGVILLGMGLARFGSVIKFIPDPVIVGFTTGIGIIIWVGQWKDFFGLTVAPGGEHFHDKLGHLLLALPTAHWPTVGLAFFSLALLLIGPRLFKRVPAPLIAMVAATLAQAIFKFDGVATIGSAFGGIPRALPAFAPPAIGFDDIVKLIGPAFTIALLGAIESLLSAVVADGMAGTGHDSNQELVGQGIANIVSPLFGGFAATGAIARTATNIRNGGNSPLAGIIHAIFLLLVVLLLAPLAAYIPLCALAAILFVVAYNMSELHRFVHLAKTAPRADKMILLITFLLTVFADLVIAVNVGVVLASLLFMRRMAQSVAVVAETDSGEDGPRNGQPALPAGTLVYRVDGPYFFGAAEKLEHTLDNIQAHMACVVLRLDHVPFVDATGIQSLAEMADDFRRRGTRLVLCGARPNVVEKLRRAGVLVKIGEDSLFPTLDDFARQCALGAAAPAVGEPAAGR